MNDHVATILEQWQRERPDLDSSPMAVLGRLVRLSKHVEQVLERNFKQYNLHGGLFDVLATLRRSGTPFCLTPTQLQTAMMLSSGATTNRIDRLEQRGLVSRQPDPNDRRGYLISLTPEGKTLIDEVVETHLTVEESLLTNLSPDEREQLAELLAILAERLGL
ncbi:MAG: MarR family transcriptional regulator [Deinococcota bacterium]